MQWTLVGDSIFDARQAKAMLDGLLGAPQPQVQPEQVINPTEVEKLENWAIPLNGWAPGPVPPEPPAMNNLAENPGAHTHIPVDAACEFTKGQIKAAAAVNTELAVLAGKKGRKSAAEQAKINELTAKVIEEVTNSHRAEPLTDSVTTAIAPIGEALKGATAEDLLAALNATTKPVMSIPGIEVRTLPETSTDLAALDPNLAALAMLSTSAPVVETVVETTNDDISTMPDDVLYQKISDHAQAGAGLFWFRNVVEQGGGKMDKMPREHMLKVLANPDAYYPAQ